MRTIRRRAEAKHSPFVKTQKLKTPCEHDHTQPLFIQMPVKPLLLDAENPLRKNAVLSSRPEKDRAGSWS